MSSEKWVPTICWNCIEGWCSIKVKVVDGVATKIEGNTSSAGFDTLSKNLGRVCPKTFGQIQKLYNPNRIRTPLKRTNPTKGAGVDPKWVPISWDEALDTVAGKLKELRLKKETMRVWRGYGGPQAAGLKGTWEPFFMAYGPSQRVQGGSSIKCDMAEHLWANVTHGGFHCEPDVSLCNYLMLLSENPGGSGGGPENMHILEARERGMKVVAVDPVLSLTAAKADEWIPIRPGTDSAFLLSLINVILYEIQKFDIDFLKNMSDSPYLINGEGHFCRDKVTNKPLVWDPVDGKAKSFDDTTIKDYALEGTYTVDGAEVKPAFQKLKDHMVPYTPEWAAGITDIPATTIRRIAREWVDNARIGSTVQIDGITFPYRPVATKMGRAITGSMRAYQTVLAGHILAALVGSMEVPGGHCGGRWQPEESGDHGITPGPDSVPASEKTPFAWPPISYDCHESLFPYSKVYGLYSHLAFLNVVAPPEGYQVPSPEIYIQFHCNPVNSVGETAIVMEALKKIPMVVSFAYVLDEMTYFSDILLPDRIEFERFELVPTMRSVTTKRYAGAGMRQPVVTPLPGTMDISDVFTELAARIGMLEEYDKTINTFLGLAAPYELEPGKKYEWIEIVDRHCRSVTNGAHDVKWFQETSGFVAAVPDKVRYAIYTGMKETKLRYQLPYLEEVKRTGEELAQNLSRAGVNWWSTAEYVPLPVYVPPRFEKCDQRYDFYVTDSRSMQFSWGGNVDIPWLIELGGQVMAHDAIAMNARTAAARGIKDGDRIWVESEVGKIRGRVKLIEGIRPDTLAIVGQFGQWAMPVARETGRPSLSPLLPISYEWTDTMTGCMQGQVIKARVYKEQY